MAGLTTGETAIFWGLVELAGAAHNMLACLSEEHLLNINVITPKFRLESELN